MTYKLFKSNSFKAETKEFKKVTSLGGSTIGQMQRTCPNMTLAIERDIKHTPKCPDWLPIEKSRSRVGPKCFTNILIHFANIPIETNCQDHNPIREVDQHGGTGL